MSSGGSKGIERNHRAGALLRRMKQKFGGDFDPVLEALSAVRNHTLDEEGNVRDKEFDEDGNCVFDPDLPLFVQAHLQAAGFVFPKLKAVEVEAGDGLQQMVISMTGVQPKDGSEHAGTVIDITPQLAAQSDEQAAGGE